MDRRLLRRVVGIGLASFVLGYAVTALLFFRGSDRPDVVSVPDLRELTEDAARRRLGSMGLLLEMGEPLPHPEVSVGEILAQSPLPGREVAPGTKVRVLLSAGRPRRTVPEVSGLAGEAAGRLLGATGFTVRVTEVEDARPAGRVVSVLPAPGTPVQLPAEIELRVSTGPPRVEVPALFGLDEDEAIAALRRAGLRMGEVEREPAAPGLPDMVVGQAPQPGDSVPMGRAVRIRLLTNRPEPGRIYPALPDTTTATGW